MSVSIPSIPPTVISGLLGIGGSVVGYFIAGRYNLKSAEKQVEAQKENLQARQQAITQRERGLFLLEKKVDALTELYTALEKCHWSLHNNSIDLPESDREYEDEVVSLINEYMRAARRADLYLNEHQSETVEEAQSQFFHVRDCICNEKDGIADEEVYGVEDIEREEFDEAANDVQEMLRAELAEPIRILEDGHPERRQRSD